MQKLYVLGHYGTGNLGDEAIFSGIRRLHSVEWDIVQLNCGISTYKNGLPASQTLQESFSFDPGKLLVGGGGIPHNEALINSWLPIMEKALFSGLEVTAEGIGLEGCPVELRDRLPEFFLPAEKVSLRSRRSLEILDAVGYKGGTVVKDFACNMGCDTGGASEIMPSFKQPTLPLLGIVSGHTSIEELSKLIPYMTKYCNVLYIPQVRHTLCPSNAVIIGESIWSNVHFKTRNNPGEYKCCPFPGTAEKLLGIYRLLDGMIATRFHSYILSEVAELPVLVYGRSEKVSAYLSETDSELLIDGNSLREVFDRYIGSYNV